MMNILEKMQTLTESLDVKELLKEREQELKELEDEISEITECEIYRNYLVFNDAGLTRALDLATGLDINNRDKNEVIRLIDTILKTRIEAAINEYGRYEKNKDKDRYVKELSRFKNEKEFLSIYEDIEKLESYEVKIEFTKDEYDDYSDEMTEEEFNDELDADIEYLDTLKGYLEDFEYDEIDENRIDVTCIGDKELRELEELLDVECTKFEFINIYTAYGIEGDFYNPIKNKYL